MRTNHRTRQNPPRQHSHARNSLVDFSAQILRYTQQLIQPHREYIYTPCSNTSSRLTALRQIRTRATRSAAASSPQTLGWYPSSCPTVPIRA